LEQSARPLAFDQNLLDQLNHPFLIEIAFAQVRISQVAHLKLSVLFPQSPKKAPICRVISPQGKFRPVCRLSARQGRKSKIASQMQFTVRQDQKALANMRVA